MFVIHRPKLFMTSALNFVGENAVRSADSERLSKYKTTGNLQSRPASNEECQFAIWKLVYCECSTKSPVYEAF